MLSQNTKNTNKLEMYQYLYLPIHFCTWIIFIFKKKKLHVHEKFEETIGLIRSSKSKDRQFNSQNKKDNSPTKHYKD